MSPIRVTKDEGPRMTNPAILPLAAAAILSLGLLAANFGPATPEAVAQATPAPAAPDLLASPKATDVVDAADAFLATLSDEHRAIAQIELKPELAARWTNFPGDDRRNGLFFHQM